ncbi:MAG: hypothetical protein M0C28_23615 [Candidatus Moduliflexus flocculans]|nr:hypothetical protein [Candidatus Moduliflexus flocculans]
MMVVQSSGRKRASAALEEYGITLPQFFLIQLARRRGAIRPSEAAEELASDRPTLTLVARNAWPGAGQPASGEARPPLAPPEPDGAGRGASGPDRGGPRPELRGPGRSPGHPGPEERAAVPPGPGQGAAEGAGPLLRRASKAAARR